MNKIGRFELRRVLGKGAQATVWLGFDARLEREVAVKLITAGADVDPRDITHWLQEARSVSRLTHPSIVPVFEADVQDGKPYLVFEFVPGRTLAEHLRARGALPPHEALALMLGVLEALQAAHAAGVVHRDLKPSNILVDGSGRSRVMDFGIAARLNDRSGVAGEGLVVGTPNYMSPEATRGATPTPAMDVFSAGLVLVEMLAGQPLVRERDPYAAMRRIAEQDLALPAELPSTVDDPLRAVLRRAIARDPAQRFADASAFADALRQWMTPRSSENDAAAASNSGTLDFLLRRMRHKSDFPALSDSIARIQRIAASENESLASLSSEILKDVALTNKLLRLVNSAHFTHAGGGSISTVSRAVALVGFAGIRNMALSLVLLEHMHDKGHANQLKEEFLRALMAGSLAGELCHVAREGERVRALHAEHPDLRADRDDGALGDARVHGHQRAHRVAVARPDPVEHRLVRHRHARDVRRERHERVRIEALPGQLDELHREAGLLTRGQRAAARGVEHGSRERQSGERLARGLRERRIVPVGLLRHAHGRRRRRAARAGRPRVRPAGGRPRRAPAPRFVRLDRHAPVARREAENERGERHPEHLHRISSKRSASPSLAEPRMRPTTYLDNPDDLRSAVSQRRTIADGYRSGCAASSFASDSKTALRGSAARNTRRK